MSRQKENKQANKQADGYVTPLIMMNGEKKVMNEVLPAYLMAIIASKWFVYVTIMYVVLIVCLL